jgi:hypothetical protein
MVATILEGQDLLEQAGWDEAFSVAPTAPILDSEEDEDEYEFSDEDDEYEDEFEDEEDEFLEADEDEEEFEDDLDDEDDL